MSRDLTEAELHVLELIRVHYGAQNTVEDVSWVNLDEAVLWVKDREGTRVLVANLTNLANWHADGTISTEQLHDWLRISET